MRAGEVTRSHTTHRARRIATAVAFARCVTAAEPVGADDTPTPTIPAEAQPAEAQPAETPSATVTPLATTPPPTTETSSLPPAVPPDRVSGIAVPDETSSYIVARVALYPLRIGTVIVMAPLRGGAWLLERYQIRDRIMHLLFSDDGTFGIFPTAFVESEFGWNVGLHLTDSDLFGHHEHLNIALGYGGELKQRYDANLTSGPLFGGTRLGIRLSYRAWDRSNFFGIGNARPIADTMTAPVDALTDDVAVHTRFGQNVSHAELTSSTPLVGPLSLGLIGAFTHRTFTTDAQLDGYQPTLDVYAPMSLVGFSTGLNNLYGEVSLGADTRAIAARYISSATPSSGWWTRVSLGFAQGVRGDPSHYARYNVDVRRYLDLYHGDRVLVLRAYLEGATGPLDAIPFTDLPRIGGTEVLRGFAHDRFRDRVAAVGSAEYDFPVHKSLTAYAFVDAGRVADTFTAMELKELHVGVGGGLQFHTLDAFLFRLQVGHSVEGTFVRFALEPTYDLRAKNRRK